MTGHGDPPFDADGLAEIERRIDDMQTGGNFVRAWTDDAGRWWSQQYRNHVPAGEPSRRFRSLDGEAP